MFENSAKEDKKGQAGWKMNKNFWCEHAHLIGTQEYVH